MKKTYILYCCIISVILMPFKWFAPENMTDSGGIFLDHYWCSADSGKAYRSKRTDSGGNWISGNKKDCQAIKASQSFYVPDQNRTDAPASGGRCSIH